MPKIWDNAWRQNSLSLFVIALAALAAYSNTFSAPFYLDDFSSIIENPLIYNFDSIKATWDDEPLRTIGNLSFAFNYHFRKQQPGSYHLVNICIHILCGSMVFFLVQGFLRSPALSSKNLPASIRWLPIFTSLLFVLHPLQTQAVTYIVQRLTSLTAFFYLASLTTLVYAHLTKPTIGRWCIAILCPTFALLAFFTKQSSFTLPVALLLIEIIFFLPDRKRMAIILGGAILCSIAGLWILSNLLNTPLSLATLDNFTRETDHISRFNYLTTQFTVLWRYLGLFVWPEGLHLYYKVPLTTSFPPTTVLAIGGHLTLIGAAFFLIRRSPLLAFAVLFYYLAHFIESGIIPIRDLAFEHRTYLPNVGACMVVGWIVTNILPDWLGQRGFIIFMLSISLVLAITTWQRNTIWSDPMSFWRYEVELEPNHWKGWNELGKHLLRQGKNQEAYNAIIRSRDLQTNNGTDNSHINEVTIVNMALALKRLNRIKESLQIAEWGLTLELTSGTMTKLHNNAGVIYFNLQKYNKAEKSFRAALSKTPGNIEATNNLATIYIIKGQLDEADALLDKVLQRDSSQSKARKNKEIIQNLRQRQGK